MQKLLSRSAKGLRTQLRATRWHVNFYQTELSLRGLHTEIDELCSSYEASSITSPEDRVEFGLRRVTLRVIQDPSQMTVQEVVDALQKFHKFPGEMPKYQAVVILATPRFASWLEASSELIPKALQHIIGIANSAEVDVVCACIDGLAPRPKWMKFIEDDTENGEGFAILHSSRSNIPDILETNNTPSSRNMKSTLTFMMKSADIAVTIPLANTLFRNGRHSTLLISRWRSSGGSFVLSKEQIEKQNVNLQVFGGLLNGRLPSHICTVPLTPIRRIVNGLGNIVRRIEFGEGDVGPASRELETNVTKYLAKQGDGRSAIDVWALVIPEEAFSGKENESEKTSIGGLKDVRQIWSSSAFDYQYVGQWLEKGATLCRVLSGGGGWGPKQGLLSLDPQTTYGTAYEARFDFSETSLDEQQVSALGNIAREGLFIQFLVAEQKKGEGEKNPEYTESTQTSVVIGAIPSTVDEIDGSSQKKQLDKGMLKDRIQVYNGHFGCVSESGMFLHRPLIKSSNERQNKSMIKTKIDLPYSYIFRSH